MYNDKKLVIDRKTLSKFNKNDIDSLRKGKTIKFIENIKKNDNSDEAFSRVSLSSDGHLLGIYKPYSNILGSFKAGRHGYYEDIKRGVKANSFKLFNGGNDCTQSMNFESKNISDNVDSRLFLFDNYNLNVNGVLPENVFFSSLGILFFGGDNSLMEAFIFSYSQVIQLVSSILFPNFCNDEIYLENKEADLKNQSELKMLPAKGKNEENKVIRTNYIYNFSIYKGAAPIVKEVSTDEGNPLITEELSLCVSDFVKPESKEKSKGFKIESITVHSPAIIKYLQHNYSL